MKSHEMCKDTTPNAWNLTVPTTALLLLAMYSLHDSKGPSVWYLSGVAIRL